MSWRTCSGLGTSPNGIWPVSSSHSTMPKLPKASQKEEEEDEEEEEEAEEEKEDKDKDKEEEDEGEEGEGAQRA